MSQVITGTIENKQLVVGDGIRTENAKPKTGVIYLRGDLLYVDANNVADHPTVTENVVGEWNAIALADMSAEQSTYHANHNLEMPIYVQGAFDVAVVTVKGEALATGQMDAVRAQGLKNKIELRKVVGN
ncbi:MULTISPECIES: hypothetical protein [Acinetobacter]|jgi:hypothetical protein|uniref:Head decoration protein n=1 Tax=Acinetobacter radioresistens TaxID=40216 RepID=A0A8H2K7B5_ACIRA|nr:MULTISPECIES: hypothetical protein [Acinetobacter]EXB72936.1 hypothetical protein J550_1383 [Acinetobacter sp. 230853]EXE15322.1 hypothetical protein J559_0894 [Acinetobacter sp. 983759]KCX37112.1 hypothetical protein J577_1888 [Acinetobacter sp. 263903-1]MCM1936494.1 hypothetical protein [Acinetobacter radioresistens]MCM1954110.1 hypothetical protein [Acinetobacter radioresistens]